MNQVNKKGMNQKTVNEELKRILHHFPKCDIKILLGDFNPQVGRGNNSKTTYGNASLHEDIKDNGAGIVKFNTSKVKFNTSKIQVVKAGKVVRMRKRCVHRLVGKPKGKRLRGIPRRR
jgi:hypothetical protein